MTTIFLTSYLLLAPSSACGLLAPASIGRVLHRVLHPLARLNTLYTATYGILAQAAPDVPINNFLGFLSKIMLLCGVVAIFWGGWKTSRGETAEGVLAIIGGFIIALAVPILRYLGSLGGVTF
jgi:hypothetical protein